MRRIVNTEQRSIVSLFLQSQSNSKLQRLQSIGPEYVWILRHMYGPLGSSVDEICRVSGWTAHQINPRRDQALYLLGFEKDFSAAIKRAAKNRLEDFEIRQRLFYLRDKKETTPGDRQVIDLVTEFGSVPSDITKESDWSLQTLFHAIGRLAGIKELKSDRLGDRVRQVALGELLRTKSNPKADLELEILSLVDQDVGIVDLAEKWEAEPTLLSAVIYEVRRTLSLHHKTSKRFNQLNRKKSAKGEARGSLAIRALNAELLPLYKDFRRATGIFSADERSYLKLRSSGISISKAGKKAFDATPWRAMAIDRAFLKKIIPNRVVFPVNLPLPPFTKKQRELMEFLKYVKL
jgi:hypothetical protein